MKKKVRRQHYFIRRKFLHEVLLSIRALNPASTFLILQSLAGCMFYGVVWFVVPLIMSAQQGQSYLGVGLSMFDLAIVLLGAALGKIAERANIRRMIFLGLLLFGVSGLLIGFNLNIWFLLFGFIATAGDEMSLVSLWVWLDRLDETHDRDGIISGAVALFEDLGWTIGPILGGFLYYVVGPEWTIAIGALPIVVLWVFSTVAIHIHVKEGGLLVPRITRE